MSVVKILDDVTEWVQHNICDKTQLPALPPDNAEPVDAKYEYQLVTPTAFTLFVPTKDKLPPKVLSPIPSVCVRFLEGSDTLDGHGGSIALQLAFSTWDLGDHAGDLFYRQKDGSYQRESVTVEQFKRSGEGWRSAWNFVDLALRAIENTTAIAGYEIDRQVPIEFGPLADQEGIPDYYPFWFCWINLTLRYPITRNIDDINELL